jgi:hypothetical protein
MVGIRRKVIWLKIDKKKMLRKILKMSKLEYSKYEFAKLLNEQGYKTKRGGKKFYNGTIDYIVKSTAA